MKRGKPANCIDEIVASFFAAQLSVIAVFKILDAFLNRGAKMFEGGWRRGIRGSFYLWLPAILILLQSESRLHQKALCVIK